MAFSRDPLGRSNRSRASKSGDPLGVRDMRPDHLIRAEAEQKKRGKSGNGPLFGASAGGAGGLGGGGLGGGGLGGGLGGDPSKKRNAADLFRDNKKAVFAVAAIAVVIASWIINPSVGTKHSFSKASDYNAEKEQGCTNSGKGCHGSESSYANFNDYHPKAKCTTCHDYQGAGCIPCHTPPGNHECALCHDGSMEGVADATRLGDPFPKGHYRETTHTATGTTMSTETRAAVGGKAKAICRDCHSQDLKTAHESVPVAEGSEYGTTVGCGECHNDQRSFGQKQVLSEWKERTCQSCHSAESTSPMHDKEIATKVDSKSPLGCGSTGAGCHDTKNLHALHANAPKTCAGNAITGEPGCHELNGPQAKKPTVVTCAGTDTQACHRGYKNDVPSHSHDTTAHAPTNLVAASDTSFKGTACGDCHRMGAGGPTLVEEHALPTSARSNVASNGCQNCHADPASEEAIKNDWEARDTTSACSVCHGTEGLDAAHASDPAEKHAATDSSGCAASGPGCHQTTDLMSVGDTGLHSTCLRCHDWRAAGGNKAYDPTAKSCGAGRSCHASAGQYVPSSGVHDGTGGLADGNDGDHHTVGDAQASATLYDAASGTTTKCSACHDDRLGAEHARGNSAIAKGAGTLCTRCHGASSATVNAVARDWPDKNSSSACADCHGRGEIPAPHAAIDTSHVGRELSTKGVAQTGACTRSGCHDTNDLRRLHANDGCTTAGCHTKRGDIRGKNLSSCGGTDSAAACHANVHTLVDGNDFDSHYAGMEQADAKLYDEASETSTPCRDCHTMFLSSEHRRASSAIAADGDTLCTNCHQSSATTRSVVRYGWAERTTEVACESCHNVATTGAPHASIDTSHTGIECAADGSPKDGSCVKSGCHGSLDLRKLHTGAKDGCTVEGCHKYRDDIFGSRIKSCGGTDKTKSCHVGITADDHLVDHNARLAGVVNGVSYGIASNVGCFGCHASDLRVEHARVLAADATEGGGATSCAMCHVSVTGAGDYASARAVKAAVAARDKRCVSCHKSGCDEDDSDAVASPHKRISDDPVLPAGRVWADPLGEWKIALEATTGGGHNAVPADVAGASSYKRFPITEYSTETTTYTWALPPNSGVTSWLKASAFPGQSVATAEDIQSMKVTCEDCHVMPANATGPHGSAVKVSIDPEYSQTEYANPSAKLSQFSATGTDRVVCYKCHDVPGGNTLHARHASHPKLGADDPAYFGEKCVDCHVRIPHAWKRPRLLVRTVETTDGVSPDTFPYVAKDHDGLVGIKLQSFDTWSDLKSNACSTGGCFPNHSETRHPEASDVPTATYWP